MTSASARSTVGKGANQLDTRKPGSLHLEPATMKSSTGTSLTCLFTSRAVQLLQDLGNDEFTSTTTRTNNHSPAGPVQEERALCATAGRYCSPECFRPYDPCREPDPTRLSIRSGRLLAGGQKVATQLTFERLPKRVYGHVGGRLSGTAGAGHEWSMGFAFV
jgi:hypothetical protein